LKKILSGLLVSLLVAGTAFINTRAAWTDTVSLSNNIITSGTVDLQLAADGLAETPTWEQSNAVSGFNVSGLYPGASVGEYSFSARNNAPSIALALSAFASNVAVYNTTDVTKAPQVVDKTKLTIAVYDYNTSTVLATQTLAEWEAATATTAIDLSTTLDSVNPIRNFGFTVTMADDAGNEWQGKTVEFTLDVIGTSTAPTP